MTCSVEGCESPVRALGVCTKHYTRLRRHGDVDTVLSGGRPRQHRECRVPGCSEPHLGRDFCRQHYDAARHLGFSVSPEELAAREVATALMVLGRHGLVSSLRLETREVEA